MSGITAILKSWLPYKGYRDSEDELGRVLDILAETGGPVLYGGNIWLIADGQLIIGPVKPE